MTQENQKKLSVDQRKAFVDMIGWRSNAHARAEANYNESHEQLEEALIKSKAEELGAPKLVKEITDLKARREELTKAIDESKNALEKLGFRDDGDGDLALAYGWNELSNDIQEQIEQKIGSKSAIDKKFEQAQIKVLKAETAEEAAAVVESLI